MTTRGMTEDSEYVPEDFEDEQEEKIVNLLRIHFADPYTRCCREKKAWKKFLKKLILLVLKLAIVTTQVS